MKFILGTKEEMTQVFDDQGRVTPVTVVQAGPLQVTQVKTVAADRYTAVQFGYGQRRVKNLSKAMRGHQRLTAVAKTGWRYLREQRLPAAEAQAFTVGQPVDVSIFEPGDQIQVSGLAKGKGFQGVVKRHGFGGGRRSHGQKHSEREPGSIGGGGRAGGRVAKGMRMAGRMGGGRVSVKNLKIVQVDKAGHRLLISGALPGHRGTLLEIYA